MLLVVVVVNRMHAHVGVKEFFGVSISPVLYFARLSAAFQVLVLQELAATHSTSAAPGA